jgi:hypothetical protein
MKKKTKEEFREVFTYDNFKQLIVKNRKIEAQLKRNQDEIKELKDSIISLRNTDEELKF